MVTAKKFSCGVQVFTKDGLAAIVNRANYGFSVTQSDGEYRIFGQILPVEQIRGVR